MEKEQLLKIINEVDSDGNYFGIIPLYPVYIRAKVKSELSISEFQELLLSLEHDRRVYLETINDITRLSLEEKKIAIYNKIRGYLYYIGFWK